jgi:hypothetical protein
MVFFAIWNGGSVCVRKFSCRFGAFFCFLWQLVSFSPVTWGASVNELTSSGTVKTIATNWETSTTNSGVGFGGLSVDASGNLYLADSVNNRIVKFTSEGTMSVFAGSGTSGSNDGSGTAATFNNPTDLAIDSGGNVFVNDNGNSSIRKISPTGMVSTITRLPSLGTPIAVDQVGNIYTVGFPSSIQRIGNDGGVSTFSLPGISDFITALVADNNGNIYAGTRGLGAQILKISF